MQCGFHYSLEVSEHLFGELLGLHSYSMFIQNMTVYELVHPYFELVLCAAERKMEIRIAFVFSFCTRQTKHPTVFAHQNGKSIHFLFRATKTHYPTVSWLFRS